MTLRAKLIRIAHENPQFRAQLLPLIKEAASAQTVGLYLTKGGDVGAEIKTRNDGESYSFNGKWGAGSGHDYDFMAKQVKDWMDRKSGFQVKVDFLKSGKEAAEPSLNDAEMDALKAVAKAKGRNWKGWLMDQWPSSKYPGFEGDITAQLQSVRNKIGPSGLKKIKLGSEKSAGAKGSIESHIEMGMVAMVEEIKDALAKEFSDSIKFHEVSTTMRLSAAVEGEIQWQGDDSGKNGYLLLTVKSDQFDLGKGLVFIHMDLPNGKRMQKEFDLPSGWMAKSPEMLGREVANVLGKNWIDPFFGAA